MNKALSTQKYEWIVIDTRLQVRREHSTSATSIAMTVRVTQKAAMRLLSCIFTCHK